MDWFRSKELQQHIDASKTFFSVPAIEARTSLLKEIFDDHWALDSNQAVHIHESVLKDAQILPWLIGDDPCFLCSGTQQWLERVLKQPIFNVESLRERQHQLQSIALNPSVSVCFTESEPDVLWALSLPPIEDAWPMPLLFPQWFVLRWIQRVPWLLNIYQLYRIYGIPMLQFIYPISLVFGPWWYIRTKLKWSLPFTSYLKFIKKMAVELFKMRTGQWRELFLKMTTFVVYVGLYIYGWIQSIDLARMLHRARQTLQDRLAAIHRFMDTAERAWEAHSALSLERWGLKTPVQHSQRPLLGSIACESCSCHLDRQFVQ
jgi:hypothetical protein